ncbi:MAG: hypothetical protein AAFQ94_11960 [Bacteroidota bacterium]
MKNSLNKYFNDVFLKTNGFLPAFPFGISLEIGDFFLIENGNLFKLGSLKGNEEFFDFDQPVRVTKKATQPEEIWQSEYEVNTTFKSRGAALEWENVYIEDSRQALIAEFKKPGSYFFRNSEIESREFENFHQLSDQILQKFVSKEFNFKEIYFVTETAFSENCALSVSSGYGNLVIDFAEEGYYGLNDLVNSNVAFYPHQSKNIDYNRLNEGRGDYFKAVKLDVSFEGQHHVSRHIRKHLPENMQDNYYNLMNYGKTSVLKLTNVFPGNAVEYYSFFPMGLQDVQQLFANE